MHIHDVAYSPWQEAGKDYMMRNFVTFKLHIIFLKMITPRRMRWLGHIGRV
jgi:hypothetical protein